MVGEIVYDGNRQDNYQNDNQAKITLSFFSTIIQTLFCFLFVIERSSMAQVGSVKMLTKKVFLIWLLQNLTQENSSKAFKKKMVPQ